MDLVLEPSYRKLWRLMRERHLKKKDLQFLTGLSPSVITKLGRNETVHLETLLKICSALKCELDDIVEIVPKENTHMANFTKTAIKSTFVSLLEEQPLNQITVKMIVEECGINRNTFYYYYQDLPALVEEIVQDEVTRILSEHPTIDTIETALSVAVDFTSNHRRAILHIYNSVNRDIFEQYLWRACEQTIIVYFHTAFPDAHLSEKDRYALLQYHTCTAFGAVSNWLNSGMRRDLDGVVHRMCEISRGMLPEMIRRCEKETSF